jgi:hypothetical protein
MLAFKIVRSLVDVYDFSSLQDMFIPYHSRSFVMNSLRGKSSTFFTILPRHENLSEPSKHLFTLGKLKVNFHFHQLKNAVRWLNIDGHFVVCRLGRIIV